MELYGCDARRVPHRPRLARTRRLVRALRVPLGRRHGRFASSGTGVAHCPTSNLRLGAGVAPVREYLDAGIRVGLGVDGSASNERSDLLDEVKQALLVARGRGGPAALTAREALALGSRGGAAVLGRDDIGSLEPGRGRLRGLANGRPRALGRRRRGRRPRLLGAAPGRPARRRGRGRGARRCTGEGGRGDGVADSVMSWRAIRGRSEMRTRIMEGNCHG